MKKQDIEIDKNRKRYTQPGGASFQFRPKNAIYISQANKVNHEMAKCLGAYMLRKWGDVKLTPPIVYLLNRLDEVVNNEMKDFPKNPANFITEAVAKKIMLTEKGAVEVERRIDLVNINNHDWFEFENQHKINKSKSITFYI